MVGAAATGLLFGRLVAMLVQGTNPLTNPTDILIVRGGVHTGAASAAAIGTYLWAAKWRFGYLDATAPAALMGLAGWHAGCLWRDACLGSESDLPWAWAQDASVIARHPVELYAAVGLLLAAWIVSRLPWSVLTRAGVALSSAGLVRLVTEPMRPSITGGPVGWYLGAIVVGVAVAVIGPRVLKAPSQPT
jgi:prolipoprotein diacylglyceryltransferase